MKALSGVLWVAIPLLLSVGGCGGKNAVTFVTKTSIGVDFDSTPPSASFAYDRVEGYIAPRYPNGAIPPVVGSVETNGDIFTRAVKQYYATGLAAEKLTNPGNNDSAPKELTRNSDDRKMMFFGTSTTLGAKISFNTAVSVIDGFTLGYKRKELSFIPLDGTRGADGKQTDTYPAVIGVLDSDVKAAKPDDSELAVTQLFATGTAALALAENVDVRSGFLTKAKTALGQYRDAERTQQRSALNALTCLAKIPDAKLAVVWKNARATKLFDDDATIYTSIENSTTPAAARAKYADEVTILNPSSETHSVRLNVHSDFVCDPQNR